MTNRQHTQHKQHKKRNIYRTMSNDLLALGALRDDTSVDLPRRRQIRYLFIQKWKICICEGVGFAE